jgi:hypothetical protein
LFKRGEFVEETGEFVEETGKKQFRTAICVTRGKLNTGCGVF